MASIQLINDLSREELELYSASEVSLCRYNEPEPGIFIAESDKVLIRALDAGYRPISLLMEDRHRPAQDHPLIRRCEESFDGPGEDFPVYTGNYELLKKLVGYGLTGGILCAMHRKPLPSVLSVISNARRIAVLENVVNPTNIGAIFRSAAAMGVEAVLLTMACCDPLYRRAVRVSMGNVFLVPWTYLRPIRRRTQTSNRWESMEGLESYMPAASKPDGQQEGALEAAFRAFNRADSCSDSSSEFPAGSGLGTCDHQGWPSPWLDILKNMGFTTAAMALKDRSVSISEPKLKEADRLAIILGTEGEGLLEKTIAQCDYTVKIPMSPGVDSLNVAAASAVAFWELCMKG